MACPIQFLINPIEFNELSVKVDKILRIMERNGMSVESVPVMTKRCKDRSASESMTPKLKKEKQVKCKSVAPKPKTSKRQPSAPTPSPQTLPNKKVIDFDDDDESEADKESVWDDSESEAQSEAQDVDDGEVQDGARSSKAPVETKGGAQATEGTSGEGNEEELAMIELLEDE